MTGKEDSQIIELAGWKTAHEEMQGFNELLKKAKNIQGKEFEKVDELVLTDSPKFFFEARLCDFVLEKKWLDKEIFRCCLYIAKVMDEWGKASPESYYVGDYHDRGWEEKNPDFFRKGGDLCFLLCAFFRDFTNRRNMRWKDYVYMGQCMYNLYSAQTKKTIGWCMCNNFNSMIEVVKEGVKI